MANVDTSWQTKPTDRFVLRWIKVHLSARITPRLLTFKRLRPWTITATSSILGVAAGLIFALGWGFVAACVASISQVLDGVDGQFARLTGHQSTAGAFLDSILDRYADGSMVIGIVIYLVRLSTNLPTWLFLLTGSMALIGGNLISYSSSRADNLEIDTGRPTLASKGTRTTAMILSGWGSVLWPVLPFVAICYLALHTNIVVVHRLAKAHRYSRSVK